MPRNQPTPEPDDLVPDDLYDADPGPIPEEATTLAVATDGWRDHEFTVDPDAVALDPVIAFRTVAHLSDGRTLELGPAEFTLTPATPEAFDLPASVASYVESVADRLRADRVATEAELVRNRAERDVINARIRGLVQDRDIIDQLLRVATRRLTDNDEEVIPDAP